MKKLIRNHNAGDLLKIAVVVVLLVPGITSAATATTNLAVSASVAQTCTITTTPLAFGVYDPVVANVSTNLNGNGTVVVTCTKGATGVTVGMDNGTHFTTTRRMLGGTSADFLSYELFQPPNTTPSTACTFPGTTAWTNTGAGLLTLTAAPSKAARTYNVCGTVPQAQDVSADPSYTDTVIATVTF